MLWRETATQQTQDDLDGLLDFVLPFAEQAIARYGEFFPFGAVTTVGGELRAIGTHTGDQHPNSTTVLELLYESVQSDSEAFRASAFVADIRIDGSDAIRIELEACEGTAIQIVVPYKRMRLTKKIALGAIRAQGGEHRVWHA